MDGGVDIGALFFQQSNPRAAFFQRDALLSQPVIAHVIQVDHLADFGEAEPDILGPQNPRQPGAIAARINTILPLPLRRDQALVFIKANGARCDVEGQRQFGDRKMASITSGGRGGRSGKGMQQRRGRLVVLGSLSRIAPGPSG